MRRCFRQQAFGFVDDRAESDVGRAIVLAGTTASAVFEMGLHRVLYGDVSLYLSASKCSDECDAPPWRFIFIGRELICGAVLGAHAAHDATVQFVRKRFFGGVWCVCCNGHGQMVLTVGLNSKDRNFAVLSSILVFLSLI